VVGVEGKYYAAGEMRIPGGAFHNPGSHLMGELLVYIEQVDNGEMLWEMPPKWLGYDIVIEGKRMKKMGNRNCCGKTITAVCRRRWWGGMGRCLR